LNREVLKIEENANGIDITLNNGEKIEADHLFSTLPSHQLLSIMPQSFQKVLKELTALQHASVAVVNLGYRDKVLDQQGFGYLVPQKEQQNILGMVWDSSVFPEQSESKEKTRLTVMVGGTRDLHFMNKSKEDFLKIALDAVKQHLTIIQEPDVIEITIASQAIPQYPVDYQSRIKFIQTKLNAIDSRFNFLGTSFAGVSVNDCIANSYKKSLSPYD
jgi:oxygen-dependent protoporphyrinogen oxidase